MSNLPDAAPAPPRRRARVVAPISAWLARRDALGLVLAAAFAWASLTPSLLPRTWPMQGVATGVSFALGYLAGFALHTALARVGWWPRRLERWSTRVGWIIIVLMPVELVLSLRYRGHDFQALGYDTSDRILYSGVLLVAAVVVAALTGIALVIRWQFRLVQRRTSRRLPWIVATALAASVSVLIIVASTNQLVHRQLIENANDAMSWRDTNIGDDEPRPPRSPYRTAGPGSPVAWDTVGHEGRRFLDRGPTAADIRALTADIAPARAVVEPVRVYVGRASADGFDAAARLAVAELDRTGGFDRAVLHIVTPTGTGWMNEQFLQPVEYLHAGDVATVAIQYSHLPSGFALLDDRWGAVESTRALHAAIDAHLKDLPVGEQPVRYVSGESLGSFGGGGAYADLEEMVATADGGVWTGPPPFNERRREAERQRDPGSLQVHPTIATLPELAFGQDAGAFDRPDVRFAFLQNADDPFMFWEGALAVRRPDWLREPLDARVNPDLRWFPFVTWFQIGLDQAVGNSFQQGQGHLYGTLPTDAWFNIIDPPGWSDRDVDALRTHMSHVER